MQTLARRRGVVRESLEAYAGLLHHAPRVEADRGDHRARDLKQQSELALVVGKPSERIVQCRHALFRPIREREGSPELRGGECLRPALETPRRPPQVLDRILDLDGPELGGAELELDGGFELG